MRNVYDNLREARKRKVFEYNKLEFQKIIEEIEEIVTKNKCDKCDFIGKSEAGLKIHKTSKHKVSLMKMYRKVGEK